MMYSLLGSVSPSENYWWGGGGGGGGALHHLISYSAKVCGTSKPISADTCDAIIFAESAVFFTHLAYNFEPSYHISRTKEIY